MPDRDIPPDPTRDPVDEAYGRAEAMLDDEAARAARRARVLAAVAREPAAAPALPRRVSRQPGGWLAAAGVAGLSLFVATQLYRPTPRPQPAVSPLAPAATVLAPPRASASPPPAEPQARPIPPRVLRLATPPPPAVVPLNAPAPPPLNIAPVEKPRPAPVPPPPPPPILEVPGPAPAAIPPADAVPAKAAPAAGATSFALRRATPDGPARLRAAAAAGRTDALEALLAEGVPADAPDGEGETALMRSIEADRPAAAAILRRHGASLDRRNRAGQTARDMAATMADPALDEALGLEP